MLKASDHIASVLSTIRAEELRRLQDDMRTFMW